MQYTEIFKVLKNEKIQQKMFNIFLKFAQNTDCGNPLEPPRQGGSNGSNEYPQYIFGAKLRKIDIPLHIPILLLKVGFEGVYNFHGHVFPGCNRNVLLYKS